MKSLIKKFKKIFQITDSVKDHHAGLFIPHRQTSWLIAGFLIGAAVLFLLGYVCGYKSATDHFLATTQQESFADKINYSLYTMNDLEIGEFETKEEDTNGSEATESTEPAPEEATEEVAAPEAEGTEPVCESLAQVVQEIPATPTKMSKVYVAPLAGFGTLQAAQTFAKKIQTIDPYVVVKKRISKTARGKTVAWHQVVTGEFDSEEKLQAVLDQLKQKERLKDLKIIEKRKAISS